MSEESELRERAEARVGTVLHGKYRVDAVLGIGGMGAVFATTHRNQKRFAVKVLHPELSLRSDLRQRFIREGYLANSLQHPGAVAILDDDVADDGAAFLVMELLEGATVERLWEAMERHLPPQVVLAIAHEVLDTLAAAHAKSIVHRDVKPANLFLQRDGAVKVLDFGVARLKDATAVSATNSGALLGTPAFMAPEQATGETNQIGGETDVWAVGATMFTLLSGKLVRVSESAQQMIIEAATRPARSLASVRPDLPAVLVEIVDAALAFDRRERGSAVTMRAAVGRAHEQLYGGPVLRAPLAALIEAHEARMTEGSRERALAPAPENAPDGAAPGSSRRSPLAVTSSPFQGGSLGGGTTARSVSKAASRTDVPPQRWRPMRVVLPLIGGLVMVAGVGVRFLRQRPSPPSDAPPASLVRSEAAAPPPSTTAPIGELPPRSVKLAVGPPMVSVEIDGAATVVEGGTVVLNGAAGSMHMVHLVSGPHEGTFPVLLTEGGAVPRAITLPNAAPLAPGAPSAKRRDKTGVPDAAAPAAGSVPRDSVSRTME